MQEPTNDRVQLSEEMPVADNAMFDVNTTWTQDAIEAFTIIKNNEDLKPHELMAVGKMVRDLDLTPTLILEHNITYLELTKRWAKMELEKLRAEKGKQQDVGEERKLGLGLMSTLIVHDEDENYKDNRLEKRSNELIAALADLEKMEIQMGYTTPEELKQEAAVAAAQDVVASAALGQYKMPDFGEAQTKRQPMNRAERRAAAKLSKKKGR